MELPPTRCAAASCGWWRRTARGAGRRKRLDVTVRNAKWWPVTLDRIAQWRFPQSRSMRLAGRRFVYRRNVARSIWPENCATSWI